MSMRTSDLRVCGKYLPSHLLPKVQEALRSPGGTDETGSKMLQVPHIANNGEAFFQSDVSCLHH